MQTQNIIKNRGLGLDTQLMFGIYAPIVSIGVAYSPRILKEWFPSTQVPILERDLSYAGCFSFVDVAKMLLHGDQERWNECYFQPFFLIVGAIFLSIVIIDLIIKCCARPITTEATATQGKKKEQ